MARDDTAQAIGAVDSLLVTQLARRTGISAEINRPDQGGSENPRFNLFLYEAVFDASMRSLSIDGSTPEPLWLALHYLLTAYDETGQSDTVGAHRNLGRGLRALQEMAYLPVRDLLAGLGSDDQDALRSSPEPIKVTFLPTPADLIGRLMQGSEEDYRFSMAFEVRPVMIATREPSEDALLVGIRYREPPPPPPGSPPVPLGVDIVVDAGGRPVLSRVEPTDLELTLVEELPAPPTLRLVVRFIGAGLAAGDIPLLGASELPPLEVRAGALVTRPDVPALLAADVRPGVHTIAVRALGGPRPRTTDPQLVRLRPTLETATVPDPPLHEPESTLEAPRLEVRIALTGQLLGQEGDDVVVALWAGRTVASGDALPPIGPAPTPTARTVVVHGVPPGLYRVIVRVNGAQARHSPLLEVLLP